MTSLGFVVVACGAAIGAWLRWFLGLRLNGLLPPLPLGTLAANLIGGFLIGIAVTVFDRHAALPPEAKFLVITGFLGGLTTFSTFSAELTALLLRADLPWALGLLSAHVGGSVLLTAIGIMTVRLFSGA